MMTLGFLLVCLFLFYGVPWLTIAAFTYLVTAFANRTFGVNSARFGLLTLSAVMAGFVPARIATFDREFWEVASTAYIVVWNILAIAWCFSAVMVGGFRFVDRSLTVRCLMTAIGFYALSVALILLWQ